MRQGAQFFTIIVLGCGSSGGVPRIGNVWGACDPKNPKNRRSRCSILIKAKSKTSEKTTNILIDSGCDVREQLLRANIDRLNAVFYTHEHADHTHGIDDLRVLALSQREQIQTYMSQSCADIITKNFSYCFNQPKDSNYHPFLKANIIKAGEEIIIDGAGGAITILPFLQHHANIDSLGFRIGDFAYSCDLSSLAKSSYRLLDGVKIWLLDALRYSAHPCHLNVEQAVNLVNELNIPKAYLTNLHIDLDYDKLSSELPNHIRPAYDGLEINMELACD